MQYIYIAFALGQAVMTCEHFHIKNGWASAVQIPG
jgi:hypothetical protein